MASKDADKDSGDHARAEQEAFERLKAELQHSFRAPETAYKPLTPAQVIARNRAHAVKRE